MLVEKGFRVTFDLLVKIGRMRYDDHRQSCRKKISGIVQKAA